MDWRQGRSPVATSVRGLGWSLAIHAQLSKRFVQGDRYRVAEVKAAHVFCYDRYAKDLIGWIAREEFLTKPFGFASKDECVALLKVR